MFQNIYSESKRDSFGKLDHPSSDSAVVTYVQSVLRKLQLSELQAFAPVFLEDSGELATDFFSTAVQIGNYSDKEWFFVEQVGAFARAFRFKTLKGVSAQFCTKLLLQESGAILVSDFDLHSGIPSLVRFRGSGLGGDRLLLMGAREACNQQFRAIGQLACQFPLIS